MIVAVASEAVRAMRDNPNCLAAVLLAALMVGVGYLSFQDETQRSHERSMSNRALMLEALQMCPLPDDRAREQHPHVEGAPP